MKLRSEGLAGLLTLLLLGAVSFSHLIWGGAPLPVLLQQNFYLLVGGRLADRASANKDAPLIATLSQENERLHSLLSLKARLPGQTRAALVARREPETWWSRLEVEFALSDPVPPKGTAMVLTPQGLVGTLQSDDLVVVSERGQTFCRGTVELLSSAETQLSVVVGESQAAFLLEGKGGANFALRPVTSGAEKAILPGDAVETSGLGTLYTPGLQVGQIDKDTRWALFTALNSTPAEVLLWWR